MATFKITHRVTAAVLFELECNSFKLCLEAAIKSGANLRGANLHGANLDGADLSGANLYDANLDGANLDGADLSGANLDGANLRGANLRGANLDGFKVDVDLGLIQAGMPNNWHAFGYVDKESRQLRVRVGCRHKSITEGRAYWSDAKHPKRDDRREVLAALDYIETVAQLRGWQI